MTQGRYQPEVRKRTEPCIQVSTDPSLGRMAYCLSNLQNSTDTQKGPEVILFFTRHGEKKSYQQVSQAMTICCIITKSLDIKGEIHLISEEVVSSYFKTKLKAASVIDNASNDKRTRGRSLLNASETMCHSVVVNLKKWGKPLTIQTNFIFFRQFI